MYYSSSIDSFHQTRSIIPYNIPSIALVLQFFVPSTSLLVLFSINILLFQSISEPNRELNEQDPKKKKGKNAKVRNVSSLIIVFSSSLVNDQISSKSNIVKIKHPAACCYCMSAMLYVVKNR